MNLKLRWQSKPFWVSVIALVGLIGQFVCKSYGIEFDMEGLNLILTGVLTCAIALGLVVDPTTPGIEDSNVTLKKNNINETADKILKEGE